jgi:maltose O-acetyltransferase
MTEAMAAWPIRVLGYATRIPQRLAFGLERKRLQRRCVLLGGTQLLPGCKMLNFRSDPRLIEIGRDCRIAAEFMIFGHGGKITVGSNCFIGEGSRIWSANNISIGDNVLISHNVNIHDTNSHSLSAARRRAHVNDIFLRGHPPELPDVPDSPVVIEDDVWIGFNSTIMKGVTIGKGAVIGACSVITKDVAAFTVVVGTPARVVGQAQL